tara:strand:+ start:10944 stop:11423 length:480 start_codon:yes stop_codon:yes gene_type:complete
MSDSHPVRIRPARFPEDLVEVGRLFRAYADSLSFDLDFQDFKTELANLPGAYAKPQGTVLLAECESTVVGCVAVRPLEGGVAEMKRLYVMDAFRGRRLGRLLAQVSINAAREIGYKQMRLDTVAEMIPAIALYESLGFETIEAYCHNPLPSARFFELRL